MAPVLYRQRRQAVDRFFSSQNVEKLQGVIQEHIDKLCTRMSYYERSSRTINLTDAFDRKEG
jgi:cytochrome P450